MKKQILLSFIIFAVGLFTTTTNYAAFPIHAPAHYTTETNKITTSIAPHNAKHSNNGMIAFILGLVGLVTGLYPLGIVAIILGSKAMHNKDDDYSLANAGFILGIIDVALLVLVIAFVILFFGLFVG